jgi:hypothetical protein
VGGTDGVMDTGVACGMGGVVGAAWGVVEVGEAGDEGVTWGWAV